MTCIVISYVIPQSRILSRIMYNFVKKNKNTILRGLYLLQYYMGGGSTETPKLYYVIYEQPLTCKYITSSES